MATTITNTSISTDSITAPTITGSTSVTTPTVNANTIDPTQGYLNIAQQNATGEGGEIHLAGSNGNANAVIDNLNGAIRILQGANTRIQIDPNGHVTYPASVFFWAWRASNADYGSTHNNTKLTGWDVIHNGINRGGGYNTSTSRFTAPVTGIYHFELKAYTGPNTNGFIGVEFRRNAVANQAGAHDFRKYCHNVNGYESVGFNGYVDMAANDYVEIFFVQHSGSALMHTSSGTFYSGFIGRLVA